MEGFGYTATEAKGRWITGIESSLFRPLGGNNGQEWWLWGRTEPAFEFEKDTAIPRDGIQIRVSGFLSPKGQYGHNGMYDHEFYATTISKMKDG